MRNTFKIGISHSFYSQIDLILAYFSYLLNSFSHNVPVLVYNRLCGLYYIL